MLLIIVLYSYLFIMAKRTIKYIKIVQLRPSEILTILGHIYGQIGQIYGQMSC